MLLLDDLLLSPGKGALAIFQQIAKKAAEEFLDDGPVKQELQQIYALLEAGNLSEEEFDNREQLLLQRLEQIARLRLPPAETPQPDESPAPVQSAPEVLPPYPDFASFDVPAVELPTLELPPVALPRIEFPPLNAMPVAAPAAVPLAMSAPTAPTVPVVMPATVPLAAPAAVLPAEQQAPVRLSPGQVVECALRGLAMLKMKVSTVTAVTRAATGWQVIAELIESRAVPDTSDLLGIYEVQLDEAGNILGYVRTRMRRRCDLSDRR